MGILFPLNIRENWESESFNIGKWYQDLIPVCLSKNKELFPPWHAGPLPTFADVSKSNQKLVAVYTVLCNNFLRPDQSISFIYL